MVVRIRNFSDQDLPSLVKLVNEAYREAYEFFPYDQERLSSRIQEGKLKILLAEENGRVLGSTAYSDGHCGEEIEWLFVTAIPDRKIVRDMLASQIEEYVKRGTVFTAVDAGSQKIKEWAERGYEPNNGLYHMVAGLNEVKSLPSIPKGAALRSLKLNEEQEFVETVNAGFGWERVRGGDVQRWKIESPPFDEEWIQIAVVDGAMVSVVVAKPDTYYNRFFSGSRGYLGPAATLPEHRSKNLASALTVRAMNLLLEKGMESVALYTGEQNLSSMALLQKLGFRISHHWQFMRRNLSKL